MFQTKDVEEIKSHILCSVTFSLLENHSLYEIVWKNKLQPDRPQITIIRRMRFPCRITKATDTHSAYVILIFFPRHQWLRERAVILCYTYIAYLVISRHVVRRGTRVESLYTCICSHLIINPETVGGT